MLNLDAIAAFGRSAKHLDLQAMEDHEALVVRMKPDGRSCFTMELLLELSTVGLSTQGGVFGAPEYWVLASAVPGVFNYGGDLELFATAIHSGDRRLLAGYGRICIDLVYRNQIGLGLPTTTISLIEGDALGGGAEAALSSQFIVAERGHKIGFPEIMFNLFPGMGAFHLLADKLGHHAARSMLMEGTFYRTEDFHDMGLIDVLVEPGEGEKALADYMTRSKATANGRWGTSKVAAEASAVDYRAMSTTVDLWVERAMTLQDENLKLIDHLVKLQRAKADTEAGPDTEAGAGVEVGAGVEI